MDVKNFFDVRTFGAVMSTGDMRCGQIRGPVQFGFAESIDSIVGKEISMSRTAAVSVDDPDQKRVRCPKINCSLWVISGSWIYFCTSIKSD